MSNPWKVISNRIDGKTVYSVVRQKREYEPMNAGNLEKAMDWTESRADAIRTCNALNMSKK